MADDGDINASELIDPMYRLPFDGYRMHVEWAPAGARLGTNFAHVRRLDRGQSIAEYPAMLVFGNTPEERTSLTRDSLLLAAMLDYINSGGDPEVVCEIADQVRQLEPVKTPGFELILAYEQVDRVLYYESKDGKYVEVVVDHWADEAEVSGLPDVSDCTDMVARHPEPVHLGEEEDDSVDPHL